MKLKEIKPFILRLQERLATLQCSNISLCANGENLVVCLHSRTKTFRVIMGIDDEERNIDDVVEEIMVLIRNVSSIKKDLPSIDENTETDDTLPTTMVQDVVPVVPPEVPEICVPPIKDGPDIPTTIE